MGKHNKHRHNVQQPQQGDKEQLTPDQLMASLGAEGESSVGPEVTPDGVAENPDQISDEEAAERQKAEEAAAAEEARREEEQRRAEEEAKARAAEEKAKPAPQAINIEPPVVSAPAVSLLPPKINKPEPSPELKAEVAQMQKDFGAEDHTASGRTLISMFDEYDALVAQAGKKNAKIQTQAAMKLYDIMTMCCPRVGNRHASYYEELIRIVFNRLSRGYGELYSDATLFRQDYNLPTPIDAMRFDSFYSAMYQIVESAKTGSRITYNTTTLSRILNSASAMSAITNLRRRIESKNNA